MARDGVREVACDESGSDGENLIDGNTDVFAHASVLLPVESAAGCVQEIRHRIRSPAEEYKANHLLREKHRAVLEWVLSPAGPMYGHARVDLTEKAFFVVDRALDVLLGDAAGADALYRAGREALGADGWRRFLRAANRLLRARSDADPADPVDAFFTDVQELRRAAAWEASEPAAAVLERLAGSRERAEAYRARVAAGPPLIPVLNPLLPAIVRTAALWSAPGIAVRLVHDRQNMLTPDRVDWLLRTARQQGVALDGVELVHSRSDPRVQLADFLAGVARKLASDELNGYGDPVLTALLRPYIGAASVWGDAPSWARLNPFPDGPGPEPRAGSGARLPC
ncbi:MULTISPECIES: DUF3800 domain-containing protein [unclassified Streptomyces]|uniref:DUF3800 domain-containing protein n=1 Tax=unclassified Streptomyces TaxID=2593676 RepID=UPI002DD8DA28|nr:DUF3800 domain-containing protein [Streptomyces sp. NBC_01788]WSB31374.1 DUF3800 domain-containing protein [Streptomyces sp. NBC_01788]